MGRTLQKKKNKSSIPKAHLKPKSKKLNIRSNPIVAANWSQSLTLSQNYNRLGLTSRLNARAGGTESKIIKASLDRNNDLGPTAGPPQQRDSLSIGSAAARAPKSIIPTIVRISRDPGTGAIVRVHNSPPPPADSLHIGDENLNPLNDPLNTPPLSPSLDPTIDNSNNTTGIIRLLEAQAAQGGKKSRPRMQSKGEEEWIERLVRKWGEDLKGMSRDRKLNPGQQTEGDLGRRVQRWREGRREEIGG